MSKNQPTQSMLLAFSFVLSLTPYCAAFTPTATISNFESIKIRQKSAICMSDEWNNNDNNSNEWGDSSDAAPSNEDWQEMLARKQDGSFWNTFEPAKDDGINATATEEAPEVDEAEAWLDTLASLSAEEVEFNSRENDRADKVRQMQDWGFDDNTIMNALDVAVDDSLEKDEVSDSMQAYRVEGYEDETDWSQVESHTKVEIDEDTGEPVRQQMVYVDEHTCIGCTNCAMVAQSTFFMDDEHGRARVFNQWGDTDEMIQIAIET